MATHVFFVRHARPIVDLTTPSSTWPLAPGAACELAPIVAELSQAKASRVWSSPELRALSTAKIIAEASDHRVETLANLSEHKRDSASRPQSDSEFLTLLECFFDHPEKLVFGTETAIEALDRFKSSVNFAISEEHDDTIIVTHGTVLSLYLGYITKQDCFQIWRDLDTPDLVKITRTSQGPNATMS